MGAGGGNRVEASGRKRSAHSRTPKPPRKSSEGRRPSRDSDGPRHPGDRRRKKSLSREQETMLMVREMGFGPGPPDPRRRSRPRQRGERGRAGWRRERRERPAGPRPSTFLGNLGRALLGRMLFVVHSLTAIWQTVEVYGDASYWGFALISVAILVEGALSVLQRAGDERKWFCPSVVLFICATAPPIWLLELNLSERRLAAMAEAEAQAQAALPALPALHRYELGHQMWVQVLEQFMLVILIMGRWLLPKGEITREQLSQILLAFLAIASDIVELFDLFKEEQVTRNPYLQNMVLTSWSLSLVQFGFVLTTSKARKMRVAVTSSGSMEELRRIQRRLQHGSESLMWHVVRDADIWAILLANFLQDVPFLFTRLYLMLGYGVLGYTMIFFTCKNALIIALQTYRLTILVSDRYRVQSTDQDVRDLAKHYRQMLSQCKENLASLRQTHPHLLPPLKLRSRTRRASRAEGPEGAAGPDPPDSLALERRGAVDAGPDGSSERPSRDSSAARRSPRRKRASTTSAASRSPSGPSAPPAPRAAPEPQDLSSDEAQEHPPLLPPKTPAKTHAKSSKAHKSPKRKKKPQAAAKNKQRVASSRDDGNRSDSAGDII